MQLIVIKKEADLNLALFDGAKLLLTPFFRFKIVKLKLKFVLHIVSD